MGLRACMAWIRGAKKQIIAHLMITGNWRLQKVAWIILLNYIPRSFVIDSSYKMSYLPIIPSPF